LVTVANLFVYPVKSLRGIRVEQSMVGCRGLRFDRRWMVVDVNGVFMTQRTTPKMATIQTELTDRTLRLIAPDGGCVEVPLSFGGTPGAVRVWTFEGTGNYVSSEADRFLSQALGSECRLVAMPDSTQRPVEAPTAHREDRVGFADSSPIMIVGESSLQDLNERLMKALPMNRFRPNVVLTGSEPWEEDDWREISIGRLELHFLKRCGRCIVTTIDQATGRLTGDEPIRTLTKFRLIDSKVAFGAYYAPDLHGAIVIGDEVLVKEKTPLN
jgi:uncharacterized protein YcbX